MNGYFITGTGTGVGKTFVTCSLARNARLLGRRVFAFKPIETGCTIDPSTGQRLGADQQLLCDAAGGWQTGAFRGVYQFELPAAPLVAAEAEHTTIDLALVHATLDRGATGADLVLIEGAGGWRVPITPTQDMAALAATCGYPILIVAQATLGTINHSLLTLEAVERDGLEIAALILSRRPEDSESAGVDNACRIAARWKGRVLIHANDGDLVSLV